ncbi:MAG: peroxiredoxin [Lactobacillaceae bacterium]|jgi:peroxiredoxin (alkyl hydroperoxide reductase subunit C)|nr:peroxiredoxin [Lactobacillaceae bacterium]
MNKGRYNLPFDLENFTEDELKGFLNLDDFPYGPISPLVTTKAPDFIASAVLRDNSIVDNFSLSKYLGGSYGLIFFYPADFTYVCPTEIIAHNNRIEEFEKRNVKIVGISIDSKHAHLAWKKTPVEKGGVGDLQFPLVSDINKSISRSYRVLNREGAALRASLLIDKDGFIKHATINDLPIGRNVDETLRVIDALQFTETNGEVCPANWQKGKEALKPTPEGIADYLAKNSKKI